MPQVKTQRLKGFYVSRRLNNALKLLYIWVIHLHDCKSLFSRSRVKVFSFCICHCSPCKIVFSFGFESSVVWKKNFETLALCSFELWREMNPRGTELEFQPHEDPLVSLYPHFHISIFLYSVFLHRYSLWTHAQWSAMNSSVNIWAVLLQSSIYLWCSSIRLNSHLELKRVRFILMSGFTRCCSWKSGVKVFFSFMAQLCLHSWLVGNVVEQLLQTDCG